MADTKVVLPACPCPIRARLRRLAASYTFTGCLLPQAYGKGDKARNPESRNNDEYRQQASPTSPAKLPMLTQGIGLKELAWGQPPSAVRTSAARRGFRVVHPGNQKRATPRPAGRPRLGRYMASYKTALFSAISFLIFSKNSDVPMSSVFSFPRVRTLTLLASPSLSPTTSRNGTFCMACSRILAFIFSLRESTSTRTLAARSCAATFSAYSVCRSAIGIIATCTGESHTGNAPA